MFHRILLAFVHMSLDSKAWQAFTPTLAYIIRLAQNMGYAYIGEEEISEHNPGVQLRELKRRLWWTLVTLDWRYAGNTQAMHILSPDSFTTSMPSNVNLEEVTDNRAFSPEKDSVPTDATLLRSKCFIAEFYQKQSKRMSSKGGLDLQLVLKEDNEFMRLMDLLPPFLLRLNTALESSYEQLKVQRLMFVISTSSAIITLHKDHFIRHYHDPAYSRGVASTLSAAERILASSHEIDQARLPARRWWSVLLHAYRACVILLLDHQLQREVSPETELSKCKVQTIYKVIDQLSNVQNVIIPAKKASLVLQHLLDRAQTVHVGGHHQRHARKRSRMELECITNHNPDSMVKRQKVYPHEETWPPPPPYVIGNENTSTDFQRGIWSYLLDLELEVEVLTDQMD